MGQGAIVKKSTLWILLGSSFLGALMLFPNKSAGSTKEKPIGLEVVNVGGSTYHIEKYPDNRTVITWMNEGVPGIAMTFTDKGMSDIQVLSDAPIGSENVKQMVNKMLTDIWLNVDKFNIPQDKVYTPAG